MVLWPWPAGLAPGFPGLGELLAVSPMNELVRYHWWKGFVIFRGESRKLWLGTWSPICTPLEPWNVLGTSLIRGRQGEEERRGQLKGWIREAYSWGTWGTWSPSGQGASGLTTLTRLSHLSPPWLCPQHLDLAWGSVWCPLLPGGSKHILDLTLALTGPVPLCPGHGS